MKRLPVYLFPLAVLLAVTACNSGSDSGTASAVGPEVSPASTLSAAPGSETGAEDGRAPVNQHMASHQQAPGIATATDGHSVVVWASKGQDGSLTGVYARLLAPDGTPLGDEFRVNQATRLRQFAPAVAMNGDGAFIVAWQSEHKPGPGIGVFARRYDAGGDPLGPAVKLDTDNGADVAPGLDVAISADGSSVVIWTEQRGLGGIAAFESSKVRGRLLDASGKPGKMFREGTNPLPTLRAPTVAMYPDGRFVVVWHTDSQSRAFTGIYLRRYSAKGTPRGLFPRRVDRARAGVNAVDSPDVAVCADGGFWVTWSAYRKDTTPIGVFARHFNANGKPLTGPIKVAAGLSHPAVATTGGCGAVVVAHGDGIRMRRIAANGTPRALLPVQLTPVGGLLFPDISIDSAGTAQVVWQAYSPDGDGRGIFRRRITIR